MSLKSNNFDISYNYLLLAVIYLSAFNIYLAVVPTILLIFTYFILSRENIFSLPWFVYAAFCFLAAAGIINLAYYHDVEAIFMTLARECIFLIPIVIAASFERIPFKKIFVGLFVIFFFQAIFAIFQTFFIELLGVLSLEKKVIAWGFLGLFNLFPIDTYLTRVPAVGLLNHHVHFGQLMMAAILLCLPFLRALDFRKHSVFIFSFLFFGGLAAILSYSRASWLGIIIGSCLYFLINYRLQVWKFAPRVVVFLAVLAIVLFSFAETKYIDRFKSSFELGANIDRLAMLQVAVNLIEAKPFIGYNSVKDKLIDLEYKKVEASWNHKLLNRAEEGVHNSALQYWINFGVLGFIGIVIFLIGSVIYFFSNYLRFSSLQKRKELDPKDSFFLDLLLAISCIALNLFFFSFVEGWVHYSHLKIFLFCIYGFGFGIVKHLNSKLNVA